MSPLSQLELWMLDAGWWSRRGAAGMPGTESYDVTNGGDIQTAINAAPEGGTVRIGPGNYRLTTPLIPKLGQKLIGPAVGTAAITGDVILTGWTKDGANARWYTTAGPLPATYTDTGQCEVITGINANSCHKREQVWLDGVHLTRVMTVDQVSASTFYQDFDMGRTYIGVDPAGRLVEMDLLPTALTTGGVHGLVLQRLTFKRFASRGQSAAVLIQGTDCEVSHCLFTENHAIGLHLIQAERSHIHHNRFIKNGQLGMGHYKSHNTVVEWNDFSENNTDGFWRADWESGGFKCTYSTNTICRYNTAHNNEGIGIWFDIDNIGGDIYGNTMTDNYADGLRYEISFAAKIHDNVTSGNGFRYAYGGGRGADISMFAVAGINVNSSPDVEVYNNIVGQNQNGISIQMRNRGNSTTYGWPRDVHNTWVHHNTITMVTGTGFGEGVSGLNTLSVDVALYFSPEKNNRFDYNTYTVGSATDKRFAWNRTYMTFANFQLEGLEANGTLLIAPRAGFRVTPGANDGYWTMAGGGFFSNSGASAIIGDFDEVSYARAAFVRFTDVQIPQGAVIDAAKVEVKAFGMDTAIPPMVVYGHAADNSAVPATRTELNARVRTTASASWVPAAWINNAWTDSPPLTAIIQEIVNRPGWVAGNAITIMIEPAAIGWSTQQAISFRTYENNTNDGAGLIVNWH